MRKTKCTCNLCRAWCTQCPMILKEATDKKKTTSLFENHIDHTHDIVEIYGYVYEPSTIMKKLSPEDYKHEYKLWLTHMSTEHKE